MRFFYLLALYLSGMQLAIVSLTQGLEGLDVPVSRARPLETEPANDLPRTHFSGEKDSEYRTARIEGRAGELSHAFKSVLTKVDAFLTTLCKSSPTKFRERQGFDPRSKDFARILDNYEIVTSGKRPGVITDAMKSDDELLLLKQLDEVKQMTMDYYKITPSKRLGEADVRHPDPLEALFESPGFEIKLAQLREMNTHDQDAATFHYLRNKYGNVDAAIFVRALKRNSLENELGTRCEQVQFNWWIMNAQHPKDLLVGLLEKGKSIHDLYVAMDIVAHYMRYIFRIREALRKQDSRREQKALRKKRNFPYGETSDKNPDTKE